MLVDIKLRELERAALSGDIDAECRWLTLRMRNGSLGRNKVYLMAHMGHLAALKLYPETPQFKIYPAEHDKGWGHWKKAVRSAGKKPAILASHAAISCVPNEYYERVAFSLPLDSLTKDSKKMLCGITDWIKSPTKHNKQKIKEILNTCTNDPIVDWEIRKALTRRCRFWDEMVNLIAGRYNHNYWALSARCMSIVAYHVPSKVTHMNQAIRKGVIEWAKK